MNKSGFFETYFKAARINCLLIMEPNGTILEVSNSFTAHFGYENEDIRGKHSSVLFTEKDVQLKKPEMELEKVISTGQASDENFIVHKNGFPIWCTGESISVSSDEGHFIVKDIINLQTRKQVELLLTDSEELLETVFKSSSEIPILVLDGAMRILRANEAFKKMFDLDCDVLAQAKLSELNHPFWNTPALKNELRNLIVNKSPIANSHYPLQTPTGETRVISIKSRGIHNQAAGQTRFYIMLEEVLDGAD